MGSSLSRRQRETVESRNRFASAVYGWRTGWCVGGCRNDRVCEQASPIPFIAAAAASPDHLRVVPLVVEVAAMAARVCWL